MLIIRHQPVQQRIAPGGWVSVNLGLAWRQMFGKRQQPRLGHRPAPGESEHLVSSGHAGLCDLTAQHARAHRHSARAQARNHAAARHHRHRFERHPHPIQTVARTLLDQEPPHRWMQMHVLMRIGVMQIQARRSKRRELRRDLGAQLPSDTRPKVIAQPQPKLI